MKDSEKFMSWLKYLDIEYLDEITFNTLSDFDINDPRDWTNIVEVFKIDLSDVSVEVLDEDPYAFADAHAAFLGVSGNEPLLSVGNSMLSYAFDPTGDSQTVHFVSQGQPNDMEFRTLSGDWFIASLTADESYLVIAEPYLLEVYRLGVSS